jgi:hypothetical protein
MGDTYTPTANYRLVASRIVRKHPANIGYYHRAMQRRVDRFKHRKEWMLDF